jgi:hypothetical protein
MSVTSSDELERIADDMRVNLIGIFNKDALPNKIYNGGYIFNMQDEKGQDGSLNGGTHWVGAYTDLKTREVYYFDPFGIEPPSNIIEFFQNFDLHHNEYQIQDENGGYCGIYVIMFLFFMTHVKGNLKYRFQRYLRNFTKYPEHNLEILKSMYGHYYKDNV